MPHSHSTSSVSPDATEKQKPKKHHTNTNWHEAAACAIQIELRDYQHLLKFHTEFILSKNSYRIDLLIIKKLSAQAITKNIAYIFKTFNLFEIKGMHASVNTDSYYKTIGYAGLLISQSGQTNQYTNSDISLSFLCFHYPKYLMKHLQHERKLTVAKFSSGVYHITKEIFNVQIIVIPELSPMDNLYLHCLTDKLRNNKLVNKLVEDYKQHQEQDIYLKYMNQLTNAYARMKGETTMVCEGILNLCGTSSAEIIARTKKEEAAFYLPKIDALTAKNEQQTSQINYLKSLLKEHNISYDLE